MATIHIRINDAEAGAIRGAAEGAGMTLSSWAREHLLLAAGWTHLEVEAEAERRREAHNAARLENIRAWNAARAAGSTSAEREPTFTR